MIQIREQYGNLYLRILDTQETFEYTLEKVRNIPERSFKSNTGEWMFPKEQLPSILQQFQNQIVWMQPLEEIVKGMDIQNDLIQKHLSWQKDDDFKTWKLHPYPYQKVGCHFLADRRNAAVLDSVGLGKTLQILGAFQILRNKEGLSKFLIVTLNSIKKQWAKEVEKFTSMKALAVYGSPQKREKIIKGFKSRNDIQFLVVNYEMLRSNNLLSLIQSINFDGIALDEAQKIKTGVTDKLLSLKPSQIAASTQKLMNIPIRFLATATPIQGKPQELWSLFHFIHPDILGNWEQFRERYCKYHPRWGISGSKNEGELFMRIAPHFIRRTKEMPEIQQQLPKVKHDHIFLEMTETQEKIESYILTQIEDLKEEVKGRSLTDEEREQFDGVMQGYISFMLANCDSAELLAMSDSRLARKILAECNVSNKEMSKSPKIDYLEEFIKQTLYDEPSAKFVIFTRFERMAQLVTSRLQKITNTVIYHGQLSDRVKENVKESFVANPNIKAIVATDSLSTGANLQVANHLIHLDLPWDPTMIEQRNGRIDRTGNTFPNIAIHYLIMSDSYDENLIDLLNKKADMATSILEGGKMKSKSSDYNKLAMERMIKNKAKKSKVATV